MLKKIDVVVRGDFKFYLINSLFYVRNFINIGHLFMLEILLIWPY
jgi:hypothetical protein